MKYIILKEKDRKQLNSYQNESYSRTKLFGAKFMQIKQKKKHTRKLLKVENLETSSWEPENQCGCDVANSQWILFVFPIMPNKGIIFIK